MAASQARLQSSSPRSRSLASNANCDPDLWDEFLKKYEVLRDEKLIACMIRFMWCFFPDFSRLACSLHSLPMHGMEETVSGPCLRFHLPKLLQYHR
jgi:hypothetical protein